MASLHIMAQWRSRIEPLRDCAARMVHMLNGLAEIHPCFSEWYRQAYTREDAFRPAWAMPPDAEELVRFFEQATPQDLDGKETYPSFAVWNGRERNTPVVLSFRGNMTWKDLLLPCEVEILLSSGAKSGPELSVAEMASALIVMAEAWNIDYGVIKPDFTAPVLETLPKTLLLAGWTTYFSPELSRRFVPPPGAAVKLVPGGGTLIQPSEERFDDRNPRHIAMANEMAKAILDGFGPLPKWGSMHEARARLGWPEPPDTP